MLIRAFIQRKIGYLRSLLDAEVNLFVFILKLFYFRACGKDVRAHQNVVIRGLKNIETHGRLDIGTYNIPFLNRFDQTFLNIQGKLIIEDSAMIGKGSRIFVDKKGSCILERCSITGNSSFIIYESLFVGKGTQISWGCEFLDHDVHSIYYEGRREKLPGIVIGKGCWIGSHVKILKGVRIPDHSVVAAGSVVTSAFEESNILIAGNPARIIRRGVHWKS